MADTATVTVKMDPDFMAILGTLTDRIVDLEARVTTLRMVVYGATDEPSLSERIYTLEERNRKDDDYAQEQRDRGE